MKLSKIILIITLFIPSHLLASDIHLELSQTLGWPEKWDRIVEKTISSYTANLDSKGKFYNIPQNKHSKVKKEIHKLLKSTLSWEKTGIIFIDNMLAQCDSSVLRKMLDTRQGKISLPAETRQELAKSYSDCGSKGIKASMPLLQDSIMAEVSNIKAIIQKHETP